MSAGPVVSNSSPLIALERIARLDLPERLFGEVLIPDAVAREVFGSNLTPAWLRVREVREVLPGASLVLGAGELEAIALARLEGAQLVILDDLPARKLASSLGLKVIGTAGLLLAAKTAGLLPTVRPWLDALEAADFRLSDAVRRAVLAAAKED